MRNIKLIIEYDGKNFAGWQTQPGKVSIQGEIEKAIKEKFNEKSAILDSFNWIRYTKYHLIK